MTGALAMAENSWNAVDNLRHDKIAAKQNANKEGAAVCLGQKRAVPVGRCTEIIAQMLDEQFRLDGM